MKKSILFVCTGNSCRSVMAEGLLKDMLAGQKDLAISSAGVSAMDGFGASGDTIDVMEANGIDVTEHHSRRLTPAMVRTADAIYVMEEMHRDIIVRTWPETREKVKLLTDFSTDKRLAGEDIPDPMTHPGSYESVFQIIQDCVQKVADKIQKGES